MGEILINQLFAGSYLSEGENIGHEIINLFQDDDGNNYLFITKNGIVKNHDVESVVFVQNIKARETMEVIMKAVGLTPVNKDEINSITYAGVRLVDIFKKNIYHGDKDMVDVFDMVTYKAKKIFFPRSDKKNIDLFIKGSSKVIVIENKIKSGLNGKEDNGTTQLDKYYNYTTEYVRKHKLLEANFYIFLPNYSEIELSEEMKK